MQKTTCELILDRSNDLTIYHDYSGRAMYGSTTCALTGSFNDFLFAVALVAAELGPKPVDENREIHKPFFDDIKNVRIDNFGRSDMIFY